jgi:hypothetical protein
MRGHGGDIELLRTGSDGTVFRLILPVDLSHGGEQHVPKLVHG